MYTLLLHGISGALASRLAQGKILLNPLNGQRDLLYPEELGLLLLSFCLLLELLKLLLLLIYCTFIPVSY